MAAIRGRARREVVAFKSRLTLNPQMEEDDRREAEIALKNPATADILESCWFAALHCGEMLAKQRCDMKHFRSFLQACKFGSSERQIASGLRCFEGQMSTEDELIDFEGFVKCFFHMGMERYATDDYQLALSKMISQFLTPWLDSYRKANEHDGSGPDELLLDLPEIDRLLYVYDSVFDRLFQRYKNIDQHETRDLTLDQLQILDEYVETEEMKELMKDYGFFPKFLSYVELSKCCQYACFGAVVVDPTKQGVGRLSAIGEPSNMRRASASNTPQARPVTPMSSALQKQGTSPLDLTMTLEIRTANPLYIAELPPEFLHDEVLLDKSRFMTCFIRIAQVLFGRLEFNQRLPSICSRVEEMLAQCEQTYERMFARAMQQDCDYTEKGVPVLANTSPIAALLPPRGPVEGGFELSVIGSNWCEKRGVFVRFGEGEEAIVVRARQILKKKVVVITPAVRPKDIVVNVEFQHNKYAVQIMKVVKLRVECSNNRWQYSSTEPPQLLEFRRPLDPLLIPETVSQKLVKFFGSACSHNDFYNTKYLSREKWKIVKSILQLSEAPRGSVGSEADNDVFFLEVAEYHGTDLSLDFKGYLKVLTRTLFEMDEKNWAARLLDTAKATFNLQAKSVEFRPLVEDEITLARRALEFVERRSIVELDVFNGPVLCGVLAALPGSITSIAVGHQSVHRQKHPFLTYEHHELNTENTVFEHIRVAQSFVHLVNRLKNSGFDFSAHHVKPSVCKPAGRCWSVSDSKERVIGAVWDYPGNYSNVEWQPAEQDMAHPSLTMCFYLSESNPDFILGYILFTKAADIAHMRTLLAARQFQLRTKLYKPT